MSEKKYNPIFVQVINFPRRKLIFKRVADELHSFESALPTNSKEWDILSSIKEALYEPIEIWWPRNRITAYAFCHALGVEVPARYNGITPMGFELIELPPCQMAVFQGDFKHGNENVDFPKRINNYNPALYGFKWTDEDAPIIRLAPVKYRGHIVARPVQPLMD